MHDRLVSLTNANPRIEVVLYSEEYSNGRGLPGSLLRSWEHVHHYVATSEAITALTGWLGRKNQEFHFYQNSS